jgi:serralysin
VQRWATRQGGFWDAQQWVAGRYGAGADGGTDLANVFQDMDQTSFDLHRSTGSSFVYQRWATRKAPFDPSQKWLSGHFSTDGADALLVVFDDAGSASMDVYMRSGTGSTVTRSPRARQVGLFSNADQWFAGDFLDWETDLARLFNDHGRASIDLLTNDGKIDQRWATQQGGYWDAQQWVAGDFDGDGWSDLANVFSDNGAVSIDVHRNPNKP